MWCQFCQKISLMSRCGSIFGKKYCWCHVVGQNVAWKKLYCDCGMTQNPYRHTMEGGALRRGEVRYSTRRGEEIWDGREGMNLLPNHTSKCRAAGWRAKSGPAALYLEVWSGVARKSGLNVELPEVLCFVSLSRCKWASTGTTRITGTISVSNR